MDVSFVIFVTLNVSLTLSSIFIYTHTQMVTKILKSDKKALTRSFQRVFFYHYLIMIKRIGVFEDYFKNEFIFDNVNVLRLLYIHLIIL